MILQSLVRLYDSLVEKGTLEAPGWQPVKVSYGMQIGDAGELVQIVSLMTPQMRGKKEVLAPQEVNVPAQVKRASGISTNFLCDNSSYMLGIDAKSKPARSKECYAACARKHRELLAKTEHPAAKAALAFFENWDPDKAREHPALGEIWEEIIGGGNIVLMYGTDYLHEIPQIRKAWDEAYASADDAQMMTCLVSGENGPIARLHPNIKGVQGAQSSGASLVSFNAPAFESFGKDGGQGANAPVSQRAAFAYGAALNYLIANRKHSVRLGDATIVFWAEDAQSEYADCFADILGGGSEMSEDQLAGVMKNIAMGRPVKWSDVTLKPENHFYILGISPNAARLSARFFLQDTFGGFVVKMQRHFKRLEIAKTAGDTREMFSVWSLLNETVNQKSRDKTPSPHMAGSLIQAILTDGMYPATLMNHTQMRIRAEHEISRRRAAIVKAYLLKNTKGTKNYEEYKEAIEVTELNESCRYPAYLMGRLFALLEGAQQAANPRINATIKDRYFNSACATPAVVFPQLIRLYQAHSKKLKEGMRVYYEKQIAQIISGFTAGYPQRLDLNDQGIFQIGYYHQTQKRFAKKEEQENG